MGGTEGFCFSKLPGGQEVLGLGIAGVSGITTQNIYYEMIPGEGSVWKTEGDTYTNRKIRHV